MDHEGTFTADNNVDTSQTAAGGRSNTGEDVMRIAEGGVTTARRKSMPPPEEAEETPLLRRETERTPPAVGWTHTSEWDHLPWYKRPSV